MYWKPRVCTFSTNNIYIPLSHYYICSWNYLVHVHLSLCRDNPIIVILTYIKQTQPTTLLATAGTTQPTVSFLTELLVVWCEHLVVNYLQVHHMTFRAIHNHVSLTCLLLHLSICGMYYSQYVNSLHVIDWLQYYNYTFHGGNLRQCMLTRIPDQTISMV